MIKVWTQGSYNQLILKPINWARWCVQTFLTFVDDNFTKFQDLLLWTLLEIKCMMLFFITHLWIKQYFRLETTSQTIMHSSVNKWTSYTLC